MFIIAGLYRHQQLKTPKGNQTRPTSNRFKESLFNICRPTIEGASFLDIFAGSGAMGLEALSRGAAKASFIESDREALRCIENNIDHLKVKQQCQLFRGEAFAILQYIEKKKQKFDIIYADPPYKTPLPASTAYYSQAIVDWVDKNQLLAPGGTLFIEEEFRAQPAASQLQTLTLINSRQIGPAALQQYRKKSL